MNGGVNTIVGGELAKAAFQTITYTNEADLKLFERDMDIAVQTGILRKKGDLTGFVYGG